MVHLLDINGPAHVFYEAREYGIDLQLQYLSLNHQSEIQSSAGIYFSRLQNFRKVSSDANTLIFVPGLETHLLQDTDFIKACQPFFEWLRQQYQLGATLCSVCTGAFLFAQAGLLDHKKATTHWKYFDNYCKAFPKIEFMPNRLFVEDQGIYSSAGVASGIDLSLYLLEKEFGTKLAIDVAKEIVVYFRRSEDDPQLSVFLQFRNHLDTRIHEIQDYIAKHFSEKITIQQLAQVVAMSERNLTRQFKKATGITIGAYMDQLRLDNALHLLEQGHKVEYIAQACSFRSTNQLRNLLKKYGINS